MLFRYSFKHMDASAALENYSENKISGVINKFVTKPIEAHVTFSVDRHMHKVHLSLSGGDGFNVQTEHVCDDMYGSVDHAANKLTQQLKRKKDMLKAHKGKGSTRTRLVFSSAGESPLTSQTTDLDSVEVDAGDIVKYENARKKKSYGT